MRKVNRIAKVIKLFFKKADDFLIVAQAAGSNVKDNMDITKKSMNMIIKRGYEILSEFYSENT